jgi:hypothetical protein
MGDEKDRETLQEFLAEVGRTEPNEARRLLDFFRQLQAVEKCTDIAENLKGRTSAAKGRAA